MALMTKSEWLIFLVVSAAAIVLMVYAWPYPDPYIDSGAIERGVLEDFLGKQRGKNPRKWRSKQSATLLTDMEEAARRMAEEFGPARDEILEAAGKGELGAVVPYDGDLSFADKTVTVHLNLELDGVATTDTEKGRTRVSIDGVKSVSLDKPDGKGTDYELLAAVLAALEVRRQSDSGEGISVLLAPMALVPFAEVKKAVEAAARAGIADIRLRQPLLPN